MDTASTSAAALKLEIERLTGAINRHKTATASTPRPTGYQPQKTNVYINPNYKPPSKPLVRRTKPPSFEPYRPPPPTQKRDVVIGGVAFESSGRSLVRKDLPKPTSAPPTKPPSRSMAHAEFKKSQTSAFASTGRSYKPKTSRRGRPMNRNMTLNNSTRPYPSRRGPKRSKYLNKPCPRFTTTGSCNRGLTCMYQHDPAKIAICWPFLQGNCPHSADTCALSHDPTPERTPLCVHFANNGRCTRSNCPFPHVRVGARTGVCRDFAVLGFCEKGLDCDKQHVRECPDFAEKGECKTKGCKLPHVIRANRARKAAAPAPLATSSESNAAALQSAVAGPSSGGSPSDADAPPTSSSIAAENAQMGDEFISLTFVESESEDDDSDGDDDGDDADDNDDGEEHQSGSDEADDPEDVGPSEDHVVY